MAKPTKIVLGQRPATFSKEVTFPMLDGTTGCIKVDYRYRTRKEHAAFVDEIQTAVEAEANAAAERYKQQAAASQELPPIKQADLVDHQLSITVDTIMGAVSGWNLDYPFDRAAVEQLANEMPAAAKAIIHAYAVAIVEGHLGN